MSQQELLKKIIQVLNDVAIEYMVTGSMVSSLQGEPRSTHDIDLVVDLDISHAEKLIRAFSPPEYFLDEISVSEAINRRSMFNVHPRPNLIPDNLSLFRKESEDGKRSYQSEQCFQTQRLFPCLQSW